MGPFVPPAAANPVSIPAPRLVPTALGPVHVSITGDGPALLAIHGGMGGFDQSFILAAALLPDVNCHQVIAVSRAGYFGTPAGAAADAAAQADLHAALLDTLGIDQVIVAAVSAGGPSALHLALRHPDRCRGMVLVSAASGAFAVPRRIRQRLMLMRVLAGVPGLARLLMGRTQRDPDSMARRSIPDDALRQRVLADPTSGPLLRAFLATLGTALDQRLGGTVLDTASFSDLPPIALESIDTPCLLLHGDSDQVVPIELARMAAARMPRATLRELPGGDHTALFTHMHAVREAVVAFLTRPEVR